MRPSRSASASAIDATATISFSAVQTMLLSIDAPSTMLAAATSRSAVSSTTAGGLPGPAAITFLPLTIAALTTPGPPVTTSRRTPGCLISVSALSIVGRSTQASRFSGPPAATIASLKLVDQERRRARRVRVDVEHHRVAARHHADAVVDDGLGRVGGRRDRADDAVAGAFDQRQPVVARVRDRLQHLRARRLVGAQLVLLQLVLDAAVAGLVDRVLRQLRDQLARRLAHHLDPALARLQRRRLVGLVRAARGAHGGLDVREHAAPAARDVGVAPPRRLRLGARGVGLRVDRRHRRLRHVADARQHAIDNFLDTRLVHDGRPNVTRIVTAVGNRGQAA